MRMKRRVNAWKDESDRAGNVDFASDYPRRRARRNRSGNQLNGLEFVAREAILFRFGERKIGGIFAVSSPSFDLPSEPDHGAMLIRDVTSAEAGGRSIGYAYAGPWNARSAYRRTAEDCTRNSVFARLPTFAKSVSSPNAGSTSATCRSNAPTSRCRSEGDARRGKSRNFLARLTVTRVIVRTPLRSP